MGTTSIDWSKYGVKDEEKKKNKEVTSVDWTKYEPQKTTPQETKMLDDAGFSYADNAKRFKEFDSGIQATAQAQKAIEDAKPTFGERVKKRVEIFPQILRPLATPIAAIAESPFNRAVAQQTMPEHHIGEKPVGGLAGFAASVAIPLTVPGAGLGGTQLYNTAGNTLQRFAPRLGNTLGGRIAGEAAKGVATGVPLGVGATLAVNPQASNKELGQSALYGAGGGLVLGSLSPLIGKAFTSFMSRGKSVAPEAEQAVRSAFEGQSPKVMGNLRNATQDQYVNNIMGQIKDDVNQRMTPPLENPNELAKWLKTHLGDDISLNEIRKLPFEDLRQLSDEVRNNMSMYDVARQVAKERGYNLDDVFAGKLPSIKDTVARNASRRAYGLDAPELPRVSRPIAPSPEPVKATAEPQGTSNPSKPLYNVGDEGIPTGVDGTELSGAAKIIDVQSKDGINYYRFEGSTTYMPENQVKGSKAKGETPLVSPSIESFDPQGFKDISGFSAQTRDVYRNFEKVLGKEHAKPYLETFNTAKKDNIDMQEYWVNRLKTEVVDKLGIQKGSKLSSLVQKFGEKNITLDELKAQHPKDWEKVVEADNWFRTSYDNLIDIVNESRVKVYPNNPDKIVPKRSDYYRHFRELNGLEGLKNLFDSPAAIDSSLAGVSDFTSPRSKFAGFMQKRGYGPYKNDAVGGFLNYLPSASYATKIDPQISNFRSLASALADTTGETKNVNKFIEFLNDFSNDLSGKTNPADRFIQKIVPGGRKTMAAISWLSNRVKSNVILGNLRSVLAQTANIPSGIAFAKKHSIEGVGRTLKAIFKESEPMKQSGFLKERFAGKMYRQFDKDWISVRNPLHSKKMAEWLMETSDRAGTTFVWNSAYAKGVAENVANPVAYADDATRKLVAGRGVGEVPLFQKARVTQLMLPFQLEVANLWRVMGDFVGEKNFSSLATLFVANYLFNRGVEKVTGSGVTFDPIQALIEAFGEEDLTPAERAGRLGGEILSNLPGGQMVASALVDSNYDRKKIFGSNDPTRFGTGAPLFKLGQSVTRAIVKRDIKEAGSAAALIIPGFGGNQLKKMAQGFDSIQKGGSFTKDNELKFSIKQSPSKIAQQILFGPNATSEAQKYFKANRRPLGAKDTAAYQSLPKEDRETMYKAIMTKREREKLERQIDEVKKDGNLSVDEKLAKIDKIVVKLSK